MSKKEEWMVHIWGGAWHHDANPSIEKDLGIKEGYYYFDTEEEKNKFIQSGRINMRNKDWQLIVNMEL